MDAIKKEVQALDDREVSEQLDYILLRSAKDKKFADGLRDKGHEGMTLQDFVKHPYARIAEVEEAEVVALRLCNASVQRDP